MSVIWSGVTEEGAVVPVQVDETGKVIATAAVPGGAYVKKTGDNMTGDLTLGAEGSPVITLNESNGSGMFAGVVRAGNTTEGITDDKTPCSYMQDIGGVYTYRSSANRTAAVFQAGVANGTTAPETNAVINADGSATFAGTHNSQPRFTIANEGQTTINSSATNDASEVFTIKAGEFSNKVASVTANGSASFAGGKCGFTSLGELFFTSRNTRYKLVVQDQLVLAEPYTRQMELKEKAEQFIAGKRETKPSDPDPFDSQGGVTMDIDNSSPKRD